MYRDFYNFETEPFQVTPDPEFLFLADQYKEGLAAIIYGIAEKKGFICITGEVGVGKTTVLRYYLSDADRQNFRFVYIFNPNLSFATLLRTVLRDLDLPDHGEPAEMVERLHEELIYCYRRGETVVLFVDEAQNMPVETLENLRMLSNLETATEKLLQIVLVGQPELDELLELPNLRQLKSRIAIRTRIAPLSEKESLAYIDHRLNHVALDDRRVFTDAALRTIVRHAQGIPRNINILADNALIVGYAKRERPVTAKTVSEALKDLKWAKGKRRRRLPRLPMAAAAGAAGLLLAGSVGAFAVVAWNEQGLPDLLKERLAFLMRQVAIETGFDPASADSEPQPEPQTVAEAPPALRPPVSVEPLPEDPPLAQEETEVQEEEEEAQEHEPQLAAADPPADFELGSLPGPHDQAAPPAETPQPPRRRPVRVTVQPGDTLFNLMIDVYGAFDQEHVEMVRAQNPHLNDIDRLHTGQVLVFPFPEQGESR